MNSSPSLKSADNGMQLEGIGLALDPDHGHDFHCILATQAGQGGLGHQDVGSKGFVEFFDTGRQIHRIPDDGVFHALGGTNLAG